MHDRSRLLPDLAPLERHLLGRRGRREGREIRFLCPAHDDTRPSARWNRAKSAWYCDVCRQGGGWRDLCQRLGLEAGSNGTRREVVATYAYTDAAGHLLYEVLRQRPKGFSCRRPDGAGGWLWNLQGVDRVVYHLPEVVAAVAREELVFLVEGEKDADALAALGFTATTHAGGAGRWRAEYAQAFSGARVVVVPDNDEAGRRHAEAVLEGLRGCATELRRLDLPGVPPKGDASDWLGARRAEGLGDDEIRCRFLDLALSAARCSCLPVEPGQGEQWAQPVSPGRDGEPVGALVDTKAALHGGPLVGAEDGATRARCSDAAGFPPAAATEQPGRVGEAGPPRARSGLSGRTIWGVRRLSEIKPRPIHYLWPPYIALRKLTLLDGDPGQGKSWITAALAAAGSVGHGLPGCQPFEPFQTLFLCEDETEDILRPRLDLLGADTSRILGRDALSGEPVDLSADADLAKLDEMIAGHRPRLVVIDPIQAFLGGRTDFYRPNEVRAALSPLLRLAQRHGCALLALRHITKARNARSIYAGQGSIDFTAAARSVLLAGSAPGDPDLHALAQIKSNLGPFGPTLAYRFSKTRFIWDGTSALTAHDLLAADPHDDDASSELEARSFLRDFLAGADPLPARLVLQAAREAGIPERTLRRAKAREGIRAMRQGFGPGSLWLWCLPHRLQRLPESSIDSHTQPWQPMEAGARQTAATVAGAGAEQCLARPAEECQRKVIAPPATSGSTPGDSPSSLSSGSVEDEPSPSLKAGVIL
jgi:hypothetical protein